MVRTDASSPVSAGTARSMPPVRLGQLRPPRPPTPPAGRADHRHRTRPPPPARGAIALPIPRLPPVTMATLPRSSRSTLYPLAGPCPGTMTPDCTRRQQDGRLRLGFGNRCDPANVTLVSPTARNLQSGGPPGPCGEHGWNCNCPRVPPVDGRDLGRQAVVVAGLRGRAKQWQHARHSRQSSRNRTTAPLVGGVSEFLVTDGRTCADRHRWTTAPRRAPPKR